MDRVLRFIRGVLILSPAARHSAKSAVRHGVVRLLGQRQPQFVLGQLVPRLLDEQQCPLKMPAHWILRCLRMSSYRPPWLEYKA